jgi:hypothetical protein
MLRFLIVLLSRRHTATVFFERHRERMALSGGITEPFTSTDETAEQSAMIYEAHLQQFLARGSEISLEDFSVLVGLDARFGGRFDEYRAVVAQKFVTGQDCKEPFAACWRIPDGEASTRSVRRCRHRSPRKLEQCARFLDRRSYALLIHLVVTRCGPPS